jgi:hypothetical protein
MEGRNEQRQPRSELLALAQDTDGLLCGLREDGVVLAEEAVKLLQQPAAL